MRETLKTQITEWTQALREASLSVARRYGYLVGLLLLFLVVRYYEPEIAWTCLFLGVAAVIATKIDRLRKWRHWIYVLFAITVLWRPFFIHVLPQESIITVTNKEDHQGLFVVAAELENGTPQEFEIRDTELFALQFNRDYLWSQFSEGNKVHVKYYGYRLPMLHLYPKVFSADRITE